MVGLVTDLLKSSLDEGFKQLVRPIGMVPAALLVLLHMLVTYPPLAAAKQPLAMAISELSELWQIVLLFVVIITIGYIVQSMTSWIGQLYTGDALPSDSWLTRALVGRQKKKLQALTDRISELPDTSTDHMELELERLRHFPCDAERGLPGTIDNLMPTALGNAMYAPAWAVWNAYGIDPTATWIQLRSAAGDDSSVVKAVDEEKSAVDTLLNVSAALIVFSISAPLAGLLIGSLRFVPYALLGLLAAYGVYRIAIARSVIWGDSLRAAYDIHRPQLAKALGLSDEEEDVSRSTWDAASKALTWDQGVGQATTEEPKAVVTGFGSSTATLLPDVVGYDDLPGPPAQLVITRRYAFAVAAPNDLTTAAAFGFVTFSDGRCPARVDPSDISITSAAGALAVPIDVSLPNAPADHIAWEVSNLVPGDTALVRFSLVRSISAVVQAGGPATLKIQHPDPAEPSSVDIEVEPTSAAPASTSEFVIELADDGQPEHDLDASWIGGEINRTVQCIPGPAATWTCTISPGGAVAGTIQIRKRLT
jgi:hypothetical protein